MYPNRNFKVQIYQWRQRGDKKAALIAEERIISAATVGINKRARLHVKRKYRLISENDHKGGRRQKS